MWPYLPELFDKPVPRYTSYPTAAEFRDDVNAADTAAALDGVRSPVKRSSHPFAMGFWTLLIRPQEVSTCRVFNLGITEEAFYALR